MLDRKVFERLKRWKEGSKRAILVTGARQIGKSYAIREFGKRNYAVYYEANLMLDAEAREMLTAARNAVDFINRVALLSRVPLVAGDTLVFIDEVQECPELITLVKALVEDGRYSYAFSGSMLGTDLEGITSFPVGFVEQVVMRPLDFEEFSWAVGIEPRFFGELRSCLAQHRAVDQPVHEAMMRNYRAYMVVGGMPEVVQAYIDDGYVISRVREMQNSLVKQYALDIGKYAGTRALEVRSIFDRIPVVLQEPKPHRFVVSSLVGNARYDAYRHDFQWVVNAGVGLSVSQVTECTSPLRRTKRDSMFKIYQSDTGMLLSRFPQSYARAVYLDRRQSNLGGVFENVVAQELAALGLPMYYLQSKGVGEVDFVIEGCHGYPLPIEVKSGRKVCSHAALDALLDVGEWRIPQAVVLSRNNLSQEGKVLYAPIYMTCCLDELTEREGAAFAFVPARLG